MRLNRCVCSRPVPEPLPDLPRCNACASCGGWVSMCINSVDDLDAFHQQFSLTPAAPDNDE